MKQNFNFSDINLQTREQILERIRRLRETKGVEKETLKAIQEAFLSGHSFIIDLFWEETLVYQHEYMAELVRGSNQDKKKMAKSLQKMEETILEAKFYIEKYDLRLWESRLFRFLGRLSDYKGKFKDSISYYKKALATAKKDPDYISKKLPRHLELEAFLIFAKMMDGDVLNGVEESKELYDRFEKDKEAKEFKKRDYTVWAIWRTGLPIRVGSVFLKTAEGISKKELVGWLKDAEKLLEPKDKKGIWADFELRRNEISFLKKSLEIN